MSEGQAVRAESLGWGVKASFRSYVEMGGGEITPADETRREADGSFVFAPAGDATLSLDAEDRPAGEARFAGAVKFFAHGGMLNITIMDPALEIAGGKAVLTVVDTYHLPDRSRRLEIANLDLAGAVREGDELVIPTLLTIPGMQLLGDAYMPNTPLDPVRLKLVAA